jgi:hypothetical protein
MLYIYRHETQYLFINVNTEEGIRDSFQDIRFTLVSWSDLCAEYYFYWGTL